MDRSLLRLIAGALGTAEEGLMALLDDGAGPGAGQAVPSRKVSLADYFLLLERLTRETGDETFRLSGRPLLPGTLRFVLSNAAKAQSLGEAFGSIAESYNYLYGGTYNHVIRRDGFVTYGIDNTGFPYRVPLTPAQSHSLMECILVLMHFVFILISSEELDQHLRLLWTKRHRAKGAAGGHHLQVLARPVRFRRRLYALVYDDSVMRLPIAIADRLKRMPHVVYGLVARMIRERERRRPWPQSWAARVREALAQGHHDAEQVAAALGVSARSLRRRLQEENTSFRQLCRELRNDQAQLLLAQDYRVEEIAERLGYADERSFRRAFLAWNGITPNAARPHAASRRRQAALRPGGEDRRPRPT